MELYEYEYRNSRETLSQVEESLFSEWRTPDFARNVHIVNDLDVAPATVSRHLRELENRGKAIRVGDKWIHRDNVEELEVWQVRRMIDQLDQKQELAHQLQKRLEERIEMRKEQLRELKEEMSSWKFEKEQKEIVELEDRRTYYREKRKRLRESKRRLFGMMKQINSSNSKECRLQEGFQNRNASMVSA